MLTRKEIEEDGWTYIGFGAHTDFYTKKTIIDELELWYDSQSQIVDIYSPDHKIGFNGFVETTEELKNIERKLGL